MGRAHLHKLDAPRASRLRRRRSSGYRTIVDSNGSIHVVAREVDSFSLPVVPLLVLAVLLLVFKALAMMNVGLNDYTERLSALENGTLLERGAAFFLHPDPATLWIYELLRPLMA